MMVGISVWVYRPRRYYHFKIKEQHRKIAPGRYSYNGLNKPPRLEFYIFIRLRKNELEFTKIIVLPPSSYNKTTCLLFTTLFWV